MEEFVEGIVQFRGWKLCSTVDSSREFSAIPWRDILLNPPAGFDRESESVRRCLLSEPATHLVPSSSILNSSLSLKFTAHDRVINRLPFQFFPRFSILR